MKEKISSFNNKILDIYHKIINFLISLKGIISTGILSIILVVLMIIFFVVPSTTLSNPGSFNDTEFNNIRNQVIEKGENYKAESINSVLRTEKLVGITDSKTNIQLRFSPDKAASDYYEFYFTRDWNYNGLDYMYKVFVCDVLYTTVFSNEMTFIVEIGLFDKDGNYICDEEYGYTYTIKTILHINENVNVIDEIYADRKSYFDEDGTLACQAKMKEIKDEVINNFYAYPEIFGFKSGKEFIRNAIQLQIKINNIIELAKINRYLSIFCALFVSIFITSILYYISKKKRISAESDEIIIEKDVKRNRVEEFIDSHKIKPFLGEWFFRGIGLALVVTSTILLAIFTKKYEYLEGFNDTTIQKVFENTSGIGALMLLIIVIGIISETHKNLHRTAWFFMTCSFGYYLMTCSTLYYEQLSFGRIGIAVANSSASSMAGNIFLGIGLFAIIGYFLFYDPRGDIINRKLFRSFSIIPTLLAVSSIVVSYLSRTNSDYITNYWIKNLLFIRDSNLLFIGIAYEYSLFLFRHVMIKKYGIDDLDNNFERPYIQFQKNLVLCMLILIVTIIFFIIPASERRNFGIAPSTAFYFTLIPFFLFYKPSGRAHKMLSDVIYYAIYGVAWVLPALPEIIQMMNS